MPSTRTLFWQPTAQQIEDAPDTRFRKFVNRRHGLRLRNFDELHAWSIENLDDFWKASWDFTGVIGDRTCVPSLSCPSPTGLLELTRWGHLRSQRSQGALRRLAADGVRQQKDDPRKHELCRGELATTRCCFHFRSGRAFRTQWLPLYLFRAS